MNISSHLLTLDQDTLILTASERLSRELRMRLSLIRLSSGAEVWTESGQIMSFGQFLQKSWEAGWPTTQLLHPVQELALYNYAVNATEESARFVSTTSAARLAVKAGRLLEQYQVEDYRSALLSPDHDFFCRIKETVDTRLSEKGWVTPEKQADELVEMIEKGAITVPEKVLLAGFIDMTPLQQRILGALEDRGAKVEHLSLEQGDTSPETEVTLYPYEDEQFYGIANNIKSILDEFIGNEQYAPKIAVIVPDVSKYRARLNRVFEDVLLPGKFLPSESNHGAHAKSPWSFSIGKSLLEYDIFASAMSLLRLSDGPNDSDMISNVFLSRFLFRWAGNGDARARLDTKLRDIATRQISLDGVVNLLQKHRTAANGSFVEKFESLVEAVKAEPSNMVPSQWVAAFQQRLRIADWAKLSALDSEMYQLQAAMDEVLSIFTSMDSQIGQINHQQAYLWLKEIVTGKIIQPRRQYITPVSVLSPWDCIGLEFDHVFLASMTSDEFPEQVDPHPLIPLEIQRRYDMPHSTPQRDLELSKKLASILKKSGQKVTITSFQRYDDGADAIPSPLLVESTPENVESEQDRGFLHGHQWQQDAIFVPEQDPFPKVSDVELHHLKGGTEIVKTYHESPFLAQVISRLGARELELDFRTIDASVQGAFAHDVLEKFWQDVKTSQKLHQLSEDEMTQRIEAAINTAVLENPVLSEIKHGSVIMRFEELRVMRLVRDWLEVEKTRDLPFEVCGTETSLNETLMGLPFKVRIDRTDKVFPEDGIPRTLITDYKTGTKVDMRSWNSDNLKEPQLPLYALLSRSTDELSDADGIAFAHVKAGSMAFYVRSNFAETLNPDTKKSRGSEYPATAESWDAQINAWSKSLQEIITSYLNGHSVHDMDVKPSQYLTYLSPLLRENDRLLG